MKIPVAFLEKMKPELSPALREELESLMMKSRETHANQERKRRETHAKTCETHEAKNGEICSKTAFFGKNSVFSAGVGGERGGSSSNNTSPNNVAENDVTRVTPFEEKKEKQRCETSCNGNARKRKKSRETHAGKLGEGFEVFWKAYPRKVGRKPAFGKFAQAFRNHGELTLDSLLDALEAQKNSPQWQKDGGRYIPHPATWLHQERWLDEACMEDTPPGRPPTEKEVLDYAGKTGMRLGREFHKAFSGRNWVDFKGEPIADWKACFKSYEERYQR